MNNNGNGSPEIDVVSFEETMNNTASAFVPRASYSLISHHVIRTNAQNSQFEQEINRLKQQLSYNSIEANRLTTIQQQRIYELTQKINRLNQKLANNLIENNNIRAIQQQRIHKVIDDNQRLVKNLKVEINEHNKARLENRGFRELLADSYDWYKEKEDNIKRKEAELKEKEERLAKAVNNYKTSKAANAQDEDIILLAEYPSKRDKYKSTNSQINNLQQENKSLKRKFEELVNQSNESFVNAFDFALMKIHAEETRKENVALKEKLKQQPTTSGKATQVPSISQPLMNNFNKKLIKQLQLEQTTQAAKIQPKYRKSL